MEENYEVRPDVLTCDDICRMVPALNGHRKLVEAVMHIVKLDHVNEVHTRWYKTPGPEFAHHLIKDEFKIRMRVDNEEILAQFPTEPFITVSNHPFGGLDGIMLVHLVSTYRPEYKVMVNLILNQISAMRPNFIAVDPFHSDNPEKRKTTMQGLRQAMKHVRSGNPLGFFPAGAVEKIVGLHIKEREWQPSVMRLIKQLRVSVIPIYFHGRNTIFFHLLALIDWRLRTTRLPAEIFNKQGREMHISVGTPISVEEQDKYSSVEALTEFLQKETYKLKSLK